MNNRTADVRQRLIIISNMVSLVYCNYQRTIPQLVFMLMVKNVTNYNNVMHSSK